MAISIGDNAQFEVTSKRQLLRRIAGVFDPCGFVAPFMVRGKALLQQAWQQGIEWDEKLDPQLLCRAEEWSREVPILGEISVPRCIQPSGCQEDTELHVFVDASASAFGAVTYARTIGEGEVTVRFVASKSKITPLHAVSIPRLELMAAVLGVRLAEVVAASMEIDINQVHLWSDSENVLWWLRRQSRIFKPFVANRVAAIQQVVRADQWRHVPSQKNPADIVSRGCGAEALKSNKLWWNGPEFLKLSETDWPPRRLSTSPAKTEVRQSEKNNLTETGVTLVTTINDSDWRLKPTRFSRLERLKRVTAWVMRFIRNCQSEQSIRIKGELTIDELIDAEERILREAQFEAFGPSATKTQNLKCLQPVKDTSGIWRVDGRLKFGQQIPYDARHPIILPRKHWVTKLVIKQHHEQQSHGGTNQTLASISTRF
jgi:hypothetical protein